MSISYDLCNVKLRNVKIKHLFIFKWWNTKKNWQISAYHFKLPLYKHLNLHMVSISIKLHTVILLTHCKVVKKCLERNFVLVWWDKHVGTFSDIVWACVFVKILVTQGTNLMVNIQFFRLSPKSGIFFAYRGSVMR